MKLLAFEGGDKVTLINAKTGKLLVLENGTEVCLIDHNSKSARTKYARKDDELVTFQGKEYFVDHDDLEYRSAAKYRKQLNDQPEA